MSLVRIVIPLLAGAVMAQAFIAQPIGAASAMTASPFDGSRRIIVIAAGSVDAPPVSEQRVELMKHVPAMNERDMVVFVTLPDNSVEAVYGPAPTPAEVRAFLRRNPMSEDEVASRFTVLLVGKDGSVKLRSASPVRAEDLFTLIDAMPMRRKEMKH